MDVRHEKPLALCIPWFLLVLLVLLSNCLWPVQAESPHVGYGTNVATSAGISKTDEMGFQWVRIYFPEQVDEAERYGLKVLLLLGWEAALTDVQGWGDYVYDVVSRYRGRIAAYQICNEPNLAEMWHRPQHADPAEYVAFLREAYLRAKEADPNCIIVSAGLGVNGGAGALAMDDVEFLRGMYAAGAKPCFDVLGSHPYGFGYAPEDASSNPVHCFRRVEQQRAVMVQYGDAAKPIWLTEVGWITEPPLWCRTYDGWSGWWWQRVSLQTQADYLVRAYRFARTNWPWIGVMFIWNMDYSLAPWNDYCDPKSWFAVLNHDGTPRPAYWELARMAQEQPAPTPSATPDNGSDTGAVAGRILLQGRSNHQGALVLIGGSSATTGADGGFHIVGVSAGIHELHAQMPGYLRHSLPGLAVHGGGVATVPDTSLQAGDITGDDVVNLFDLVAVSMRYGTQLAAGIPEDVNGDGGVDLFDLILVSMNYGASHSET
jgi:hypothetical protein